MASGRIAVQRFFTLLNPPVEGRKAAFNRVKEYGLKYHGAFKGGMDCKLKLGRPIAPGYITELAPPQADSCLCGFVAGLLPNFKSIDTRDPVPVFLFL